MGDKNTHRGVPFRRGGEGSNGLPTPGWGNAFPHPTPGWGKAPAPAGGRGGLILNREDDDEPLPTQLGAADHPLTQGGGNEPPPTREGRGKKEDGKRVVRRTDQKNRHEELTRAGNYAY